MSVVLCQEIGPYKISPFYPSMFIAVVLVQVLFEQPYFLKCHGLSFSVPSIKHKESILKQGKIYKPMYVIFLFTTEKRDLKTVYASSVQLIYNLEKY